MFDVLDVRSRQNRETPQKAVAGQKTVIGASALFVERYPAKNVLRLTFWLRITATRAVLWRKKLNVFSPAARARPSTLAWHVG